MKLLPGGAPILTSAQMRAAEQALFDQGISQDALMERAGAAVARETARLAAGRPVLVLAGPGNNGSDAYVAARLLAEAGHDVALAKLGEPKYGAAARMAALWRGPTTSLAEVSPRPVVLDGLLGAGAPRPFDLDTGNAIGDLFAAADLRIAIDLPSGIDADTGHGGFHADVTIALGALKPGNVLGEGSNGGHVLLADIGVQAESRWSTIAVPALPRMRHDVNKFTRGMVVIVAGEMPGAGWLAATAAMYSGAGYVILAGFEPASGAPHALVRKTLDSVSDLERLLDDDRIDVALVGPGLGRDDQAKALLDTVLASRHDLVIDGDALSLLGTDVATRIDTGRRSVCLTPHTGEFARMFDVPGNKIEQTVAAAGATGAFIVYKGPDTVIAHPDGTAIVAAAANPWLATAGTGDVLAGLVAGRLAGNEHPSDAVSTAVWLHARAASFAGVAFTADDLIGHIPAALAQCRPI